MSCLFQKIFVTKSLSGTFNINNLVEHNKKLTENINYNYSIQPANKAKVQLLMFPQFPRYIYVNFTIN